MPEKSAKLTAEEQNAYDRALDFYHYTGKSEAESERLAWSDIQKAFPRLLQFEKCE